MRIGFLGAGQMGRALASGFVAAELVSSAGLTTYDPSPESISAFSSAVPGARIGGDVQDVVAWSDVVILAVKPQHLLGLLAEIGRTDSERDVLFVSIAAGVTLDQLCGGLQKTRVVRVMPNTPCLVRSGVSAYSRGAGASVADGELVGKLFGSVGLAWEVPESQLDAVTGLSGSGPAYVYLMIEALSDGGVRMGLPRGMATQFAAQTLLGAARLLLESGEHPGELKDRVASPGGTTIAGLQVLEQRAVRAALIDAVQAATLRSLELGNRSREPR